MNPSPDAAALLAWLATYFLHSSVLLGAAWAATRALRAPRLRELAWRTALVGGLVTATVLSALGGGPLTIDAELLARRSSTQRGEPVEPRPGPVLGLDREDAEWETVELGRLTVRTVSRPLAPPTGPSERASASPSPGFLGVGLPVILCAAWLASAAFGLVGLFLRRRRFTAALRDRRELRAGPLLETLRSLQTEHGPRRRVRLTSSPHVGSPVAIGLSEICVPDYVVCGIGQASRAALLAHELAHLRRRDAGWGLLAAVLTRLFPFQPLLRIAERRLRAEAELCCDAAAVRATSDGAAFARCLLEVAERTAGACAPAWTAAMAAPHSQLLARVEAALAGGAPTPSRARISATAAAGGMVLAALACVGPGVRSGGGEESEPAGRDEASSGAPAPTGVQSRSIGYSISDNTDPTDERPVLEVWEDGELVHRASTDDPRADLVKALKGLGYVTQEEKIELAPSPSTPTVSPSEREDPSLERPQGAESPSAGEREAPMDLAPGHEVLLRIDEDGAIHGDGAVLVAGNADDFAALRGFLSGKAQAMPRAVDPRNPDLPGLPDGVLRIAASERTPFSRVLSVMMLCGTKDVFIWRLEFQVERQDGTRERISYALPVDLAHDDESPSSPPRFTIELRGEGLTLRVPPQMGEGYSSKTQRLEVLGGMVQVLARPYPDASFTIDVQPGTSYAQVASVLGTLQRAGAKNILFLGRQD